MRLYWNEQIHKIGSDLGIEEIKKTENYWNINRYKAASLISKQIDDKQLKEISENYPSKHVEFGGFQGKYYTLDEGLRLSFENSWPKVQKNVKKALEKWGDKTYGVLTALINKGGSSSYFEIIDEISKVLNYEYVPSYLLPRLTPLKLVFKSGSNKYPRWTIPTEIIPAIKEELQKHEQSHKKIKSEKRVIKSIEKNENKLLLIERKLDHLVENLVDRKREINMIFANKFGTRFFIDNEKAVMSIKKPCSDEQEFDNRIQGLASIIDNIEIQKIKDVLKIENSKRVGTIKLMEAVLNSNNNEKNKFESLIMLKKLRNKKFPTHIDDGEFINAMKYFGQEKFPPDWQVLWENVLENVTQGLSEFRRVLQE